MEHFGTGTMVTVFKQVGTDASDSEVLKMSVNTSDSWCAQSFSIRPGMLSGPAALRGLIPLRVLLTSAVDTLRGVSSNGGISLMQGGGGTCQDPQSERRTC